MTFVEEIEKEQERYSPVRTAVKECAAEIQGARAAGKPLNAIFRGLRRRGCQVGKGYSSFRTAIVYLDRHGWPQVSDPVAPEVPSLGPTAPALPDTAAAPRDRFVDDRFGSDF